MLSTPISLLGAAQNRYSSELLSQVYKMKLDQDKSHNNGITKKVASESQMDSRVSGVHKEKLITFIKSEIYFNERKSVMLNIRDITDNEVMNDIIPTNRLLKCACESLASDFVSDFSAVETIS